MVLSQYANSLYALELFKGGTSGLAYLLKDRVGDLGELLRALRAVAAGDSMIDPTVVDELLNRRRTGLSLLDTLTDRETEVLARMAEGMSNAAIAETLYISGSAVEKHINAIFGKLGLAQEQTETHRRVAAVLAFLHGTGDAQSSPARGMVDDGDVSWVACTQTVEVAAEARTLPCAVRIPRVRGGR